LERLKIAPFRTKAAPPVEGILWHIRPNELAQILPDYGVVTKLPLVFLDFSSAGRCTVLSSTALEAIVASANSDAEDVVNDHSDDFDEIDDTLEELIDRGTELVELGGYESVAHIINGALGETRDQMMHMLTDMGLAATDTAEFAEFVARYEHLEGLREQHGDLFATRFTIDTAAHELPEGVHDASLVSSAVACLTNALDPYPRPMSSSSSSSANASGCRSASSAAGAGGGSSVDWVPTMSKGRHWFCRIPWSLISFLLATVLLSAWIALEFEGQDIPRIPSVFFAAFLATCVSVHIAASYGGAVRAFWRRTRGYPFVRGDSVEVIRGPLRGAQGHIISLDQGHWNFGIAFGDPEGDYTSEWLSAWKLRKVSRSRGQTRSLDQ